MNDYTAMVIMQRLDQLAANTRKPLSWLIILPLAVAVNLYGVPHLQNNNVPYLSTALQVALDYEKGLAIDLGIYAADTISGERRHLPSQPDAYTILGLTKVQTIALMQNISKTESGHRHTVVNQFGYMGRWQFGASALAQVGLVKRDKLANAPRGVKIGRTGHTDFLKDSSNWTIKNGYQTFLNSQRIQNKAFVKLANFNVSQGFKQRVLSKASEPARIAGFVKAAHLKGVTAAKRWYKYGIDSKDGNGMRVSVYSRQAEKAVKNASQISSKELESWM